MIVVDHHPFSLYSYIYVADGDKHDKLFSLSGLPQIADAVVKAAYSKNIYNVQFNSPGLEYKDEFARVIKELEQQKYTYNRIEVR